MEQFFKHPQTLSRLREGPLGPYLDAFTQQLCEQGYARYSARLQLRLVADFSRWLTQQGLTVHELIPEHTTDYLRDRAQQYTAECGLYVRHERALASTTVT